MDSFCNFLLMCGLAMVTLLNGASGFLNHNLTAAVNTLQLNHGLTDTKWVGNAVFTPYLGKVEVTCTCEKLMLLRMLSIYQDIFSDMLHKAKTVETETSLKQLKESVKELKKQYKQEQNLWEKLYVINSLKKDNDTIQGGAVNDFLSVYFNAFEAAQRSRKTHSLLKHFLYH